MKVISCVFLILGSFLGAGFVSGREIAEYFARFGVFSYPAILLAGVLLFFLIYLFLSLSEKVNSFMSFSNMYFGKCSFMVNILFAMSLLIITSAMFAGIGEISSVIGVDYFIMLMITSIICYFSVMGNAKRLRKINVIIVPFMLIIVLCIALCNMGDVCSCGGNIVSSLMSASSYIFINIVTLGVFILEIGRGYSKKQKLLISLIVSLVIIISLSIIVNAINNSGVVFSTMPMLELSNNVGVLSIMLAVCIWIGILTTLMSNVFVLSGYLQVFINNRRVSILLVILSSISISFIGFNYIVKYVYLVIAFIGFLITFVVCKKEIENSNITILNH